MEPALQQAEQCDIPSTRAQAMSHCSCYGRGSATLLGVEEVSFDGAEPARLLNGGISLPPRADMGAKAAANRSTHGLTNLSC